MLSFRFLNMPVQIHWPFWVIAGLVAYFAFNPVDPERLIAFLLGVGMVFISILVHELGHALTGRKFGSKPAIMLHGFGGVAIQRSAYFSRKQDLLVLFAGPAAGFVLAAICFVLAGLIPANSIPTAILRDVIFFGFLINVFWNVLNLAPVMPLDGGQILRNLMGPARAQQARYIGVIFAVGLAILAIVYGFIFVAIAFGLLAYQNFTGQGLFGSTATYRR